MSDRLSALSAFAQARGGNERGRFHPQLGLPGELARIADKREKKQIAPQSSSTAVGERLIGRLGIVGMLAGPTGIQTPCYEVPD